MASCLLIKSETMISLFVSTLFNIHYLCYIYQISNYNN